MNELAEQKVVQHLYEAHATELLLVQTLLAHIGITPPGDYRDGLLLHLRETREHARRIQEHLARHHKERGMVQVGYGFAQGVVGQVLAFTRFPVDMVRGTSCEEILLRNARVECANEAAEIAAYTALEELALAVGDTRTARLAASIRRDEERMLARLMDLIPRLADDVVRAEVNGESTYELRHLGAVDAARSVAGTAARTIARGANRAGRRATQAARPDRRTPTRTSGTRKATSTAKPSTRATAAKPRATAKKRATKSRATTKA